MTCSVHCPSAGGARFTGRTDPLSRGAGYISSASYARRGQLVTTDGELRRPTSSRCTDGDARRQNRSLASRSRHSAWLRVGQSGHAELPGRGAPPPQRHARLSGRPRSFPVPPMVRHSTSSPPRAGSGSRVGPEPDRAEGCVWPAVAFPGPGLAEGPLPLQRGRMKGAPRPLLSTLSSQNPRLAHGPVRCLCVCVRVRQIPRLRVCVFRVFRVGELAGRSGTTASNRHPICMCSLT